MHSGERMKHCSKVKLTFGAAVTCTGRESLNSSASAEGLPGRSSSSSLPLQDMSAAFENNDSSQASNTTADSCRMLQMQGMQSQVPWAVQQQGSVALLGLPASDSERSWKHNLLV